VVKRIRFIVSPYRIVLRLTASAVASFPRLRSE
jgi:hypothetical protein